MKVRFEDCMKCKECKYMRLGTIMGYYCKLRKHFLAPIQECPKAGEEE
jgi:hypothetical protein